MQNNTNRSFAVSGQGPPPSAPLVLAPALEHRRSFTSRVEGLMSGILAVVALILCVLLLVAAIVGVFVTIWLLAGFLNALNLLLAGGAIWPVPMT